MGFKTTTVNKPENGETSVLKTANLNFYVEGPDCDQLDYLSILLDTIKDSGFNMKVVNGHYNIVYSQPRKE